MPANTADSPTSWWQVLPAIPESRNSAAYARLRRVWFDHTWTNHPFLNPIHENHLTATLFENFVVLPQAAWLPCMLDVAGILPTDLPTKDVSWAYEVLDQKSGKLADVAIHARGPEGEAVIVIEAKIKGGALKSTDADPSSYLGLEEFAWCSRRRLLYLVDESDTESVRELVQDPDDRSRIISWQQLGGIQVDAASHLDCSRPIRQFVAGAIQYQFLQHGITPTALCADYLQGEPTPEEIHSDNPNKMSDFSTPWRLPSQ